MDVITVASNAIRGVIVAPPGRKLVVSDLSNIEGRMCAWLAGEAWKLDAYRLYDQIVPGEFDAKGKPLRAGPDLYVAAYAKAFNVNDLSAVTTDMRQIGKVMELMLQYEGGVGAFLTGAATYHIDLDDMAAKALPNIPAWAKGEAASFHTWQEKKRRSTFGLARETFIACDALKRLWREAHPEIVSLWKETHEACVLAICSPGRTVPCRKMTIRRDGAWLRIIAPTGRCICYASPQVDDKGKITYMGMSPYSKKWKRLGTYGGKIVENKTQFMAAEVLKENMPDAEAMGYEIVLTVHDEILSETPDRPEYNAADLSELLSIVKPWMHGLPLAAGGFEAYRYKKEG